jgi:hypothetical protein
MYWKIGLVVIGCLIGWLANGWRLQSKISSLEKQHADSIANAYQYTRRIEQDLQGKIEQIERKKNAEIFNINTRLGVALSELRQRPSRDGTDPTPTNCTAATGRELSREDAEFLTREAARADTLRQALGVCYVQYDEAREQLKKGQ